ncbi:MAG: PTS sugar transporter subunit IIA [Deltaproteobacteria bacterium]|nr:PTS sugar transporter subunit IIA [Deltaproteobacteria bacterium]
MKITTFLKREFIIEELQAATKEAVLAELAAVLMPAGSTDDRGNMVKVLMDRERLGSTGIGDGIAIPHGKIGGLDDLRIAIGRSHQGVDFNALDGKPAHLFFLLMVPENSAGQHLKVLARISRLLKDNVLRKNLMEAKSAAELFNLLVEQDNLISLT